jgi:hypothetical protein
MQDLLARDIAAHLLTLETFEPRKLIPRTPKIVLTFYSYF